MKQRTGCLAQLTENPQIYPLMAANSGFAGIFSFAPNFVFARNSALNFVFAGIFGSPRICFRFFRLHILSSRAFFGFASNIVFANFGFEFRLRGWHFRPRVHVRLCLAFSSSPMSASNFVFGAFSAIFGFVLRVNGHRTLLLRCLRNFVFGHPAKWGPSPQVNPWMATKCRNYHVTNTSSTLRGSSQAFAGARPNSVTVYGTLRDVAEACSGTRYTK